MKKTILGIVAHVDAGKTTLSESMLYLSGKIRNLGRVDHGNTFLDYDTQEKDRGITIFSSQATIEWKDTQITLLDTPGHSDFSAEMERALQVLDYAVLVINGLDGVQQHTKTIWKLLEYYKVPTFIFVNKMDMQRVDKEVIMQDLITNIDTNCIDFLHLDAASYEQISLTKEKYLEYYIEHTTLSHEILKEAIVERRIFPCYFGSALKMTGIEEFLNSFTESIIDTLYPLDFGGLVYKISTDSQGNQLTHMKITGGTLKVKSEIVENEKVDQILIYTGNKYEVVQEVSSGSLCAVKGLKSIVAGQGLGIEKVLRQPQVTPFMSYQIVLPEDGDPFTMLHNLQQLEKEDPQLHIQCNNNTKEITVQLMGEMQIEILKNIIKERFSMDVEFGPGKIVYKETILEPVVGIGHYEPLRHYAEVHVQLEPGPLNSGLQFMNACKEEQLPRQYQRAILSYLKEKEHLGVLTGHPITDMKITLLAGKAHEKHTEGGDFREATYRAVRQGLKSTTSLILEPYYLFSLEIPKEYVSKAIYDIEQRKGNFVLPDTMEEIINVTGSAPVSTMQNYQQEVVHYTKGKGRFTCQLEGYKPCLKQEEVIDQIGYDSELDKENPTGSVFCRQGAGYFVRWDRVIKEAHIKETIKRKPVEVKTEKYHSSLQEDKELERIFTSTYGTFEPRMSSKETYQKKQDTQSTYKPLTRCLLVDGYNIIYAFTSLKELAKDSLDAARSKLLDIMCNYQGYKNCVLIVVFDGYKVKGNIGNIEKYHNIYVAYTKEAQTADMYIERATHKLANEYHVVVATSDALEQRIVVGHGGYRISARELELEIEAIGKETLEEFNRKNKKSYNYPLEDIKENIK